MKTSKSGLMDEDSIKMAERDAPKIVDRLVDVCVSDRWPLDVIECLDRVPDGTVAMRAGSGGGMLGCLQRLPPEARTRVGAAMQQLPR